MPRRFSADELAASAAIGELQTESSFADTDKWRAYQNDVVLQITGVEFCPLC